MARRCRIALAAAGLVVALDLGDSAAANTVYFRPRPARLLASGAAVALAVLLLAPRVPSQALAVGAGTTAGDATVLASALLVAWRRRHTLREPA